MSTKPRVLSCIQPTGEMHIGNYFGAVKNWVDLQDNYDCVFGIVDLHAMTMPYDPKELRHKTAVLGAEILACGVDPKKSILFTQSLVPQHTELTWILNCVSSYGELTRMTQFKDKSEQLDGSAKGGFISTGLFTYPILQAADILIYRAQYVPVGKDQEQHLELTRNIAERFNTQFGEYFALPKPLYTEVPKVFSLADPTKKMSKSLGDKHVIGLFEAEESVRKKVKTAVTDTGEPREDGKMSAGVENLFMLLKASGNATAHNSLMNDYNAGTLKYSELKGAVADALVALTQSFIARKNELLQDKNYIEQQVQEMSARARAITAQTIRDVRDLCGLPQIQ